MTEPTSEYDRIEEIRERIAVSSGVGATPSSALRTKNAVSEARQLSEKDPTAAASLVPSLTSVLIETATFSPSTGTDIFGMDSVVRELQLEATQALSALDTSRFIREDADSASLRRLVRAFEVSVNVEGTISHQRVDEIGIRSLSALSVEAPNRTPKTIRRETITRAVDLWSRIDPEENTPTGSAIVRLLAIVARQTPEKFPATDTASTVVSEAADSKYPQLYAWAISIHCTDVLVSPEEAPEPDTLDEIIPLLVDRLLSSPDPRIREGTAEVLADLDTLGIVTTERVQGVVSSLLDSNSDKDEDWQWVVANGLKGLLEAGIVPSTVSETFLEAPEFGLASATEMSRRGVFECYQAVLEHDQLTAAHLSTILDELDAFETDDPDTDAFYVAKLLVDVVMSECLTARHVPVVIDLLSESVTAYETRAPVKVAVAVDGLLSAVDMPPSQLRELLALLNEVAESTHYTDVTAEALATLVQSTSPATVSRCRESVVGLVEQIIMGEDGLNGFARHYLQQAVEGLAEPTMDTDLLLRQLLASLERVVDGEDTYSPKAVAECLTALVDEASDQMAQIQAVVNALEKAAVETQGESRTRAFDALSPLLRDDAWFSVDTERLITPLVGSVRSTRPELRRAAFDVLAACTTANRFPQDWVREFVPAIEFGCRSTQLDERTAAVHAIDALTRNGQFPSDAALPCFWELLGILLVERPPDARIGVGRSVRGRSTGAAPAAATALNTLVMERLVTTQDVLEVRDEQPVIVDRLQQIDSMRVSQVWYTAASSRIIDEWQDETLETVFHALAILAPTTVEPAAAWRSFLLDRARSPSRARLRLDVVDRLTEFRTAAASRS